MNGKKKLQEGDGFPVSSPELSYGSELLDNTLSRPPLRRSKSFGSVLQLQRRVSQEIKIPGRILHELAQRSNRKRTHSQVWESDLAPSPKLRARIRRSVSFSQVGLPSSPEPSGSSNLAAEQISAALGGEEEASEQIRERVRQHVAAVESKVGQSSEGTITAAREGVSEARESVSKQPDSSDAGNLFNDIFASGLESGGLISSGRDTSTDEKNGTSADIPSFMRSGSEDLESLSSLPSSSAESPDPQDSQSAFLRRVAQSPVAKRLKFDKLVGKGSYGQVYLALDITTPKPHQKVAVKRLKVLPSATQQKRLLRELRILRRCSHNNIIELKNVMTMDGTVDDLTEVLLIFAFADTDMDKLIYSNRYFSDLHVQFFMYQILLSLKYLHSSFIIHRDIKPANIFVNSDCQLMLGDFGLARGIYDGKGDNTAANTLQETRDKPVSSAASRQPLQERAADRGSGSSSAGQGDVGVENGKGGGEDRVDDGSESENSALDADVTGELTAVRLQRRYTTHVVTRWYRAPELMLLRGEYTCAIDLWSVGCILSELLAMLESSKVEYRSRRPLFPGRTCYPLSRDDDDFAYTKRPDQLNVIFDVIGTPSEKEYSYIQDKETKAYLKGLPHKEAQSFKDLLPQASPNALDLLRKLLRFDPRERITAEDALKHPYLRDVVEDETVRASQNQPVPFEFESEELKVCEINRLLKNEVQVWLDGRAAREKARVPRAGVGSADE